MQVRSFYSFFNKFVTAIAILALVFAALPVTSASAASITVNVTDDEYLSNSNCSLREAIIAANTDASFFGCNYTGTGPNDIITLTSGLTYTLSRVGTGLTSGDLDIGNVEGTSGNLTIQTSGSTNAIIDANDINRVMEVGAPGNTNLTLIHITVTNGMFTEGAGILFAGTGTLTLNNSTVSDNTGTGTGNCGAGIANGSSATINIIDSTIEGNICTAAGADGGGLFKGTGGTLNITNSTFSNNTAPDIGGGAYLDLVSGTTNITNSTFANNVAGNRGGGVEVKSGTVTVDFSTFSGNAANSAGVSTGGAIQAFGGTVSVQHSILANSITNSAPGADCDKTDPGTITVMNSLVENNSDCAGTIISSADPKLGALTNNGGPTQTMALLSGSPAINSGGDVCPAEDQRGVIRPQGSHCDLGAYEFASPSVDVTIGGTLQGSYVIPPSEELRINYPGLDNGPVWIASTNNLPIVASLRDLWWNGSAYTSSIQLMGLPQSLLSDTYIFPSYNNVSLNDQLRFGNVGNTDTTVTVTIGGQFMDSYNLAPNQREKVNYPGVDNGPVVVHSSNGVPIIASIRDAWIVNGTTTSFSQLMGLPQSQLSDTYIFPSYNNVSLSDQLRFGNVGDADTTVTVTIAGQVMGTYDLAPNQREKVSYPGVDNGPVVVHSSNGVPIIASLREAWLNNGVTTSYFQMMGLPQSELSDKYVFPSYDNVTLSGQLRFGNVGNASTTVTVTIGGQVMGTYDLAPNQRQKVSYVGLDDGPIVVQSSNGVPIIAALRDAWLVNGVTNSFSQLMGLPGGQISSTYVFPSYNNVTYDNQLRIGVP